MIPMRRILQETESNKVIVNSRVTISQMRRWSWLCVFYLSSVKHNGFAR